MYLMCVVGFCSLLQQKGKAFLLSEHSGCTAPMAVCCQRVAAALLGLGLCTGHPDGRAYQKCRMAPMHPAVRDLEGCQGM